MQKTGLKHTYDVWAVDVIFGDLLRQGLHLAQPIFIDRIDLQRADETHMTGIADNEPIQVRRQTDTQTDRDTNILLEKIVLEILERTRIVDIHIEIHHT